MFDCNRLGCDSEWCYTNIPDIGLLCYECQAEFKVHVRYLPAAATGNFEAIHRSLMKFVAKNKRIYPQDEEETLVQKYFDKYDR